MPFNDLDDLTPQALNSRSGQVFNVRDPDFGATGDGSTDDTAAIQLAIDSANSTGGGIVFLSAGTYRVSTNTAAAPCLNGNNNIVIMGAGNSTVLDPIGTVEDVFHFEDRNNFAIKNLRINLSNETSAFEIGGYGIKVVGASNHFLLENIEVIRSNTSTAAGTDGIYLAADDPERVQYGTIRNIYVEDMGRQGVTLAQACEYVSVSNVRGNGIDENTGSVVHLEAGGDNPTNRHNVISDVVGTDCGHIVTVLGNADYNVVANCSGHSCTGIAFRCGEASTDTQFGNRFTGCSINSSAAEGFQIDGARNFDTQVAGFYAENCANSGVVAGGIRPIINGASIISCSPSAGGIRTGGGSTGPGVISNVLVSGSTTGPGVHVQAGTGYIVSNVYTRNCLHGVQADGVGTQVRGVFADGSSLANSSVVRVTVDDCLVDNVQGTGVDRTIIASAGVSAGAFSNIDLRAGSTAGFSASATFFSENWFSNLVPSDERVRTVSADTTLTTEEGFADTSFIISGTSGNVIITLPGAQIGMKARFFKRDTDNLTINAEGSEEINNAANIANTSNEVTAMIAVMCVEAAEWIITEREGTWA